MSIMNSTWAYLVSKPDFVVAVCLRHKASVLVHGPVFQLAIQNMVTESLGSRVSRVGQPYSTDFFIGYLTTISVTRLRYVDHMTMNEYGEIRGMRVDKGNKYSYTEFKPQLHTQSSRYL